ncbi:hypothetical protein BGZ94_003102 [Podila epigama]|nr:hypothetical protein BGZ94_003102 [Podila epigama]
MALQYHIRHEARIRKTALTYFGHQGIQDLAVLGAILGNNIREIGRYKVTCDGTLVQGQYSIYELIHSGILFATGRTKPRCARRRRRRQQNRMRVKGQSQNGLQQPDKELGDTIIQGETPTRTSLSTSRTEEEQATERNSGTDVESTAGITDTIIRIYPTMLANLFPAVVFKALRKKSRQLPRLSDENSDEDEDNNNNNNNNNNMNMGPGLSSSTFTLAMPYHARRRSSSSSSIGDDYSALATRRPSSDSISSTHSHHYYNSSTSSNNNINDTFQDPFLISAGSVVTLLIKHKLHRVKDLPLPRELCFMGAASLPLPPALRAMHVAWTMDFLAKKVTTPRRQRRQQRDLLQMDIGKESECVEQVPLGGLEFRQDVYAHKLATARIVRAQQQKHRQQQGQATSSVQQQQLQQQQQQQQHHQQRQTLSLSSPMLRTFPFNIPEQIKEEDEEEEETKSLEIAPAVSEVQQPLHESIPEQTTTTSSGTTTAAANPTTTCNSATDNNTTPPTILPSARQSKRLMQQILSLENKVPRSVRKWAVAARSCFSHELIAEDRLVQEWVDKQRIQVVLACGASYPRHHRLSFTEAAAATGATGGGGGVTSTGSHTLTSNSYGSMSTHQANASSNFTNGSSTANATNHISQQNNGLQQNQNTALSPFQGSSFGSRMSFAEGVRFGHNNNNNNNNNNINNGSYPPGADFALSRPASGILPNGPGADNRLSASQQMLSMHLWLSILVSPLSPQQMVYDHLTE